jgi:hypothetical protein
VKFWDKAIAKETSIHVFMGTVINYPVSIFFAWLFIHEWGITDPVKFATISTIGFFCIAFTRIYVVRYLTEKSKTK